MQASRTEISAMGAAALTGLCAGFAVVSPSPTSLVIAGMAGGAWLANAVSRPRPRLARALFAAPTLDEPPPVNDGVHIQPVSGAPSEQMEIVALVGRVHSQSSRDLVSDVAMTLTGTLAASHGSLQVLTKLEPDDSVAVSCHGMASKLITQNISRQAAQLGVQLSDSSTVMAERRQSGSFLNLFGAQLIRIGNIRDDVSLGTIHRFFRAVLLPRFSGVIPELLLDISQLHGMVKIEGHAFFGFPTQAQADDFMPQFQSWRNRCGSEGWDLKVLV